MSASMGDGTKTLEELAKEQETVDYWKERLTESGQTNARLRSELDAAKFALRDSERELAALRLAQAHGDYLARALARAVERLSEL